MKQFGIILFCVTGLFACKKSKKEQFIYNLTGGSYKYWDVVEDHNYNKKKANRFPTMSYYFDVNGTYQFYLYYKKDRSQRLPSPYDDVIEYHNWKYKSCSSIEIERNDFYVEKLTEDSLIIRDLKYRGGRSVYVKSEKQ
ncbi:MAG: hypothetical protein JWP12_3152 [Bacteroidetes bacterium]|nr:hypothetical protein [Bacteroidota bacterium]